MQVSHPVPSTQEVWIHAEVLVTDPLLLSSGLCLGQVIQAQKGESRSLFWVQPARGQKRVGEPRRRLCRKLTSARLCFPSRPAAQAFPPGPAQLPCAPGEAGDHQLPGPSRRGLVPPGGTDIPEVFGPGGALHLGHGTTLRRTLPLLLSERDQLVSPQQPAGTGCYW